jgi:hypothetical protein
MANGNKASVIQGKWRLDRVKPDSRTDISYTRENGEVISGAIGNDLSMPGGVFGNAETWQEAGIIHAQVGGEAQVARWITKHYIFKNDGADSDFLQLRINAQLSGNAKAEDLRYARAGGVVWGRAIERTAANPTPPDQRLFEIKDGGISTATVGDLGLIEAEIPVGGGSVKITIPLKTVNEGSFAPFSESTPVIHDVPDTIDEVDVLLGGRIEADADIETAYIGLAPWISRNYNTSNALGLFGLAWESRPVPGSGSKRTEDPTARPGIAGATYACAICKCSGDAECGGGRIYTIWMGKTECNRENKAKAQQLCNHNTTFVGICDRNQKRPDGKKCTVHHHDFACSDRETEDRCINRRK